MIREGKKLPDNILERVPKVVEAVKLHPEVLALYAFGSVAKKELKPLSDLDFAILLSNQMNRRQRFEKSLDLIGLFNSVFHTDEIDLIILNDAALRFCHTILKTGKLLYFKDEADLIDLCEHVVKNYIDFRYFRDSFNKTFIQGIGYDG
jgi:predicted nucleotidyltransferase